jgi:uncharacterized protein (TIGR03437 family)
MLKGFARPTRRGFLAAASLAGSGILARARPAWPGSAAPAAAVPALTQGFGPGFRSLAITRDGKTAYVAFGLSDTLLYIDLTTGEIAGAIDVSPAGFLLQSAYTALSPDGRWLAVANMGSAGMMVVDTAAQAVSQVLSVPINVACFAFARDGRLFMRHIDGGLMVAVPPAWTAKRVALPGLIVSAMAASASQANLLYCLGARAGNPPSENVFFRFDVGLGTASGITPIPSSTWPDRAWVQLEVPDAEDVAYCGWNQTPGDRFSGNLSVLDLRTLKFVSNTALDYGIQDFCLDEPARKIYVAGCWSGGSAPGTIPLVEWDMATQSISKRIMMSPAASTVAVRADPSNPRYVYSTDADHNILRRTDTLNGVEVMRTRLSRARLGLQSMIAGGDTALVCCLHNSNLVTFDLKQGTAGSLTAFPNPGITGGGYWNGRFYIPSNRDLYVLDATTFGQVGKLTVETDVNGPLTFSAGKAFNLARVGNPSSGTQVLQFDAATFKLLRTSEVLPEPGADRLIVSPDGSKLYTCNAQVGQNARLVILDAETLALRKAIDIPSDFFHGGATNFASWDFDLDNRLLYMAGFNSVYVIHLDSDVILRQLNVLDALTAAGRPQGNGGTAISGLYLSPAKDLLMAISSDFSTMYVYDLKRAQWQPRLVALGGFLPRTTCRSADGRLVYAACQMSDSVSQVDAATGTLLKVVPLTAPWTGLTGADVRHAASYSTGAVSPGQLLAVSGEYIGPNVFTAAAPDATGTFPKQLGGARVLFDGVAAPVLYAYTTVIGAIVPYALGASGSTRVRVEYQAGLSNAIDLPVAAATPGIFTADASGQGQAAALNQDTTVNSAANPEARGRAVVFYATGCGQTLPQGIDGHLVLGTLPMLALPVQVFIGGVQADVLYAGPAPGTVAGVVQVNARIPAGIAPSSTVPLVLRVGGAGSQAGVTVAAG